MTRAPLRPLSIGNVVSTGLVLYRSNLKSYFFIALQAYLWIILPLIILVIASTIAITATVLRGNGLYLWGFLAIIAFLLLIGGISKYQTNAALISRLAYQDLIGQPETVRVARQHVDPKLWRFWGVSILVGLQLLVIYIIAAIASGIVAGVLGFVLRAILGPILAGVLIFIVVALGVGIILSWYFARWMIAEVPLAVEKNLTASESIKRSWDLTQNSALRVQGVALVAFLVTIPITALTNYAPQILFARAMPGSSLFWTGTAISFVFSFIGAILVLPLWQTIKSAIYYDLRTRREGLDIKLRPGRGRNDDNDFI